MSLWDTAGQEEYMRLRALSYPETDVFLLCFSVCSETSFHNIKEKWHHELAHHCPDAKVFLVGTKIDQRTDKEALSQGISFVSKDEATALAKELGCVEYIECSALTQENVSELFEAAVTAAAQPEPVVRKKPSKLKACRVL